MIFYGQKLKFLSLTAFIIVFAGLLLLTYDFETHINLGDLITLITAISLAFHIILSGRFVQKSDVSALVFYQFLGAALVSLIGLIISQDYSLNLTTKTAISILYLGFVGTLFCYFASVWVLKYVNVLKVSIIFSLEPVFAAMFAYIAIKETLNLREMGGAGIILIGIIVYQIQPTLSNLIKSNR